MSSQSLSGTAISETNKALMPKRFYAAWVFVVILAAVLPIVIPYFIWPPQSYARGTFDGPVPPNLYGRYAFMASIVPTSVNVDYGPRSDIQDGKCLSGPAYRQQKDSTASVVLHGAYGIPFGSIDITCKTESGLKIFLGGGLLLAGLAWLFGILAVAIPFALVLRRRLAANPKAPPLLSRPVPG